MSGHTVRCWFAGLVSALVAASAAGQPAERIWVGGSILTMDDRAMRAEAIAEAGGKIVAVGSRAAVMKRKGPGTQVIDLGGRTLLPGFVDAHGHMVGGGLQALSANLLAAPDGKVQDIASLQRTLREWAAANEATVKTAGLVIGFGYDSASLAELRHPTRDDLDAVSRDIPVVAVHQSGHIGADTADPAGGVIRRRAGTKEPDGVLEESAFFGNLMKVFARLGPDGVKELVRAGGALWASFGYTTAQEGRATPGSVAILRQVADEGRLAIDVAAYPDILVDRDFIRQNVSSVYANRFRVAGAKLTIDGSAPAFTAWRDRPYYAPVGDYPKGYAGYPAITPEQAVDAVAWAYANDVQLLAHANAERASDLLIAAHTLAGMKHPQLKDRRHVLIHGQFLREDQVDAFQRLNVIPSLFPMHTFYWGDWHAAHTVGPQAANNISPTGWVRKRGMIFTSHHDAPVAFPDSMRVLDATVTRRARGSGRIIGPEQRVDVITGLKAMTIWPAYQHFEEKAKGSLEVGKLADFVILSRDPTRGDPKTIADIKVVETIKEGRTIFKRGVGEERKAALMLRPEPDGDSALSRTLRAAALYSEFDRLPVYMREPPVLAHLAAMPHDDACLAAMVNGLVATMLATTASAVPPQATEAASVVR
jgi:predicted amidohydrolase YtcJ